MITRDQAITSNEFHYGICHTVIGEYGVREVYSNIVMVRKGKTKTWKRNTTKFVIPVKHGKTWYWLTDENSDWWHTKERCNIIE